MKNPVTRELLRSLTVTGGKSLYRSESHYEFNGQDAYRDRGRLLNADDAAELDEHDRLHDRDPSK